MNDSPLYVVDGLYEADELEKWRKQLFQWLDHAENEPNIRNAYITEERVEAFIWEVSERFKNRFLDLTSEDTEEKA